MTNKKALEVVNILDKEITNPETELIYSNNFELLVAVVLSAQCTDKRVNEVTKELFKKYNTPHAFANINQSELETLIHSCGFYKNKAKNIIALSKAIVNNFGGQVPQTFNELTSLPGVGRKTANVMLIVAFNVPAIPVDTHVFRVSNRIGLVNAKTENECEEQLCKLFTKQKNMWGKLHHLILLHGRYVCKAQKPNCEVCGISAYCAYYKKKGQNKNVFR